MANNLPERDAEVAGHFVAEVEDLQRESRRLFDELHDLIGSVVAHDRRVADMLAQIRVAAEGAKREAERFNDELEAFEQDRIDPADAWKSGQEDEEG